MSRSKVIAPIILPYGGILPTFASPPACGQGSAVLGRATVGARAIFGAAAVVRADGNVVTVGDDFCLGPRSTVHIATDTYPTIIGDRVSVGMGSLIHACRVGNDVVLGDGVVLLDGCEVGDNVLIEDGSVVFPRARLDTGGVWAGCPAKRVRDVSPGELATSAERLRGRALATILETGEGGDVPGCLFVAPNVLLRGDVTAAGDASIWFGAELDARGHAIRLGARCNVQDNSRIVCTSGPVLIGADTVLGHNVTLESCTVGTRCLIGNGAVVHEGTTIADDVLLAAGAWTEPGQVLAGGSLWAGRPARPRFDLSQDRRAEIADIVRGYVAYARDYVRQHPELAV